VPREDYEPQVEYVGAFLERASTPERRFAVRVVADAEEASVWVAGGGSAVFLSRADFDAAERLAARCPRARVVLFTGWAGTLPPVPHANFAVERKGAADPPAFLAEWTR
jgi:hypothetical protein